MPTTSYDASSYDASLGHRLRATVGAPDDDRFGRVAAADGLKSETFCLDLIILINPAAEEPDATTLATVLGLSVSDAGDRPH